jgi:AcrR family transcriptional regulator
VRLALALVDETGFAGLTLARVAAAAGVATPSLYKHIGSLAELRREVAVASLDELTAAATTSTVGRSGPDAVRGLADVWRRYAREHPGRYAATQAGPDPDDPAAAAHREAAARSVAVVAAVLRGFALPETALVDAVRATRSAVHGFVALEAGGGFRLPEDLDRSFTVLVDMLVAGITALATAHATEEP